MSRAARAVETLLGLALLPVTAPISYAAERLLPSLEDLLPAHLIELVTEGDTDAPS